MFCDTPFNDSWSRIFPLCMAGIACGLPTSAGGSVLDIEFIIRGDPVGKARHRKSKSGGYYTPEKTASYERLVGQTAQAEMVGQAPALGPLLVEITAFFKLPKRTPKKRQFNGPHVKKPDIDNVVKAIFDGMQNIVMADDKQICSLSVAKIQAPIDEGYALVRVVEMPDD